MKKSKTKTALDGLLMIREFIDNSSYTEVTKFWNIITALRGPDYVTAGYRGKIKAATTEVIRHFAVGDGRCCYVGAFSGKDTIAKAALRKKFRSEHFWTHAKLAFEGLGLNWDKKNGRKD